MVTRYSPLTGSGPLRWAKVKRWDGSYASTTESVTTVRPATWASSCNTLPGRIGPAGLIVDPTTSSRHSAARRKSAA